MINLFRILLAIFILFIGFVLCVILAKQCSAKEATVICKNFLKEVFSTLLGNEPQNVIRFPVYVGWDGNRINLQLVNDSFKKVEEHFNVCYCTRTAELFQGNCISYVFEIQRKINTPEDEELELLIQKESEEILAKVMMCNEFFYPAELLTVVEIHQNILIITFATCPAGIEQIEKRKQFLYQRKMQSKKQSPHNEFSEAWENHE